MMTFSSKTLQRLALAATFVAGYVQAATNYPAPVSATQSNFAPIVTQTALYVPPMGKTLGVENLKAQLLQNSPELHNGKAVIFYEKKQHKNALTLRAFLQQHGMQTSAIMLKMQKMPLYPLYVEVHKTGKNIAECESKPLDQNVFQEAYTLQDIRPCYVGNNAHLQYTE